jgi:cation-transporting ATPase 13A1
VDKYINELIKANYDICLITGDHLLSTLKVARDLRIGSDNFLELKIENNKMKWNNLNDNCIKETNSIEEIKNLSNDYTLGITGEEYKKINLISNITKSYEIIQYIKLFCRVSQNQKGEIIKDLIKCGKYPSMCGDGSNDVGAMKLATIGVVMLNVKESKMQKKEPFNFLSFDEETTIKNWEATAIASFTSKSDSIKCIKNIFVLGRCALVTNIQMYKIFIINSLLTIYIESILAFKGIKFSENQLVYLGFVISMFFLMFSKATPLNKVNSNKPPNSIFSMASFISILGQVIVHIISINLIIYITENVDPFSIGLEKSLDEKFSPNLLNTIIFLFQIINQSIIFVVNYKGEPFMDNIYKNSSMMKLMFGIFSIGSILIFDLYPQLNEDLELITLPEDNNYKRVEKSGTASH